MPSICLTTLNASYIHASLGLRYLYANMGDLQSDTRLIEFTINERVEDIAETLLDDAPSILGLGVYIWNVRETTELVRLIKVIAPEIIIVIGGPEASFDHQSSLAQLVDHIISGQADLAFAELCNDLLENRVASKHISPLPIALDQLASPYPYYSSEDLQQRVLYVEASRGCPFKCEFCLSSLDKTAVGFDIDQFLVQMNTLIERGARHFKFVDRTFNLKTETSQRILECFLSHIDKGLFLHFELIPDRLPKPLKALLIQFPDGCLQFEIGIQSFNPEVQSLISRKQNHARTRDNLLWIRQHTTAHIHADLIFGLPGETLESFAQGFDELHGLGPQEIQVGILKRLPGTPIERHTQAFEMRYQASAPYRVLATRDVNFSTVQRMVRFARYWDLVGNSGRFPHTLPLLLKDAPFERFLKVSDHLFATGHQTHGIALKRLFDLLATALVDELNLSSAEVDAALALDKQHNNFKSATRGHRVAAQTDGKSVRRQTTAKSANASSAPSRKSKVTNPATRRQQRHSEPNLQNS